MEQVFNVFAPIFSITLLGYICGRLNLLGETAPKVLSRFVFYVAMPPLIFIKLAERSYSEIANWHYLYSYALAILSGGTLFYFIARFAFKEAGANLSLGIFTTINGNAGYLGIPICLYAFGSPLPAILATIVHMIFVYPTLITWIELDLAKQSGAEEVSTIKKLRHVLTVVIKNPLLMATFSGIVAVIIGLKIPEWTDRSIHLLGNSAIAAAIFALGLSLSEKSTDTAGANNREILISSVIKLAVIPMFAYAYGHYVFNLDEVTLGILVFVAALPSPKNAFILAQTYGIYVRRATLAVFTTTVLSAITLPIILYVFGGISAP